MEGPRGAGAGGGDARGCPQALSDRNDACLREEEAIIQKRRLLLQSRRIALEDPADVKGAVQTALTDHWEKDRIEHFRELRRYLGKRDCPLWREIKEALHDLGNYHRNPD